MLPPDALVDALQDVVHKSSGVYRVGRAVRTPVEGWRVKTWDRWPAFMRYWAQWSASWRRGSLQ